MTKPKTLAPKIEPAFLEKLGQIVVEWSYIDALQAEFLGLLLDADRGAVYVMTQNVSAKSVTAWIRTMLPVCLTHDESQNRIAELLNEMDQTRAERNTLVHGLWSADAEPGSVLVQTVRWERSEVVKTEVTTAADLNELIQRSLAVRQELNLLVKRLTEIRGN